MSEEYIDLRTDWRKLKLPEEVSKIIDRAPDLLFPTYREDLLKAATGGKSEGVFEVAYEVPGKGRVVEATVTICKNGVAVNYTDIYMRRRDPDCMVVGDRGSTDKPKFSERYGRPFDPLRDQTLEWLSDQPLIIMPFFAGSHDLSSGYGALLIAPLNAGFFAAGLADLQGGFPSDRVPANFDVKLIIYLAPPFRHTVFDGKQIVVHNRLESLYEIFSYNLYPGPSAKKGVYGMLLSMGVEECWPTLHGSCVRLTTPYKNVTTILHEGASGGGKSEMLEYAHRQPDGRFLLGENIMTKERLYISLNQCCTLQRVSDDMAICPKDMQGHGGWLVVEDAEEGWFVRLDHIKAPGTDPILESWTTYPKEPLIFLNLAGVAGATCNIWEHIEDAPGKPCPNPRVIIPRRLIPDRIDAPVSFHYRNMGIRTPPCTAEHHTYGIIGYLHVLPPALAWLWRLVAPRGHDNPSITDTVGLSSEGVGSYWPFASGRKVDHANLLLRQMQQTPLVRYTLTPNQYVGVWHTSFMPRWIAREFLARKGLAAFDPTDLSPAKCALLGYALNALEIEGTGIPRFLLKVEEQPEVSEEAYIKGSQLLQTFFKDHLKQFLHPDLSNLGRSIIECCMDDGEVEDYENLLNFS